MKNKLLKIGIAIIFTLASCNIKKQSNQIESLTIDPQEFNVSYPKLIDWMTVQTNDTFKGLYLSDYYTFQIDDILAISTSDNIFYTLSSDKKHIAFNGKSNGEGWIKYRLGSAQEISKPIFVEIMNEYDYDYIRLIENNNLPDATLIQYGAKIKNFKITDLKLPSLIIGGFAGCSAFDKAMNDINDYHILLPNTINYYLLTSDSVVNKYDTTIYIYSSFYKVKDNDTLKVIKEVKNFNKIFGNNVYSLSKTDFRTFPLTSPCYIYLDKNGFVKYYDYGGPIDDELSRKSFLINFIKKLRSL